MLQNPDKALVYFMYQLEHMAVLLAVTSAKEQSCGTKWRQQQYGKVIKLLDQMEGGPAFPAQLLSVAKQMWTGDNRPAKAKVFLKHDTAVNELAEANLYKNKLTRRAAGKM